MPKRPPLYRPHAAARERGRKAEHDARRREAKAWRGWYNLAAWQQRRDAQLAAQPVCERCEKAGRIVAATVANHRVPHRGDWDLFITGALESVCKRCHDSVVQAEERAEAARVARLGHRMA